MISLNMTIKGISLILCNYRPYIAVGPISKTSEVKSMSHWQRIRSYRFNKNNKFSSSFNTDFPLAPITVTRDV